MTLELKKRIITSLILLSLLTGMYLYPFVMIISLVVIAIIIWIEFYALISKIIKENSNKGKILRFLYKTISLFYLSFLVFFILMIESHYYNLKIYLLYSILVAVMSDIGGLIFGRIFKGKKLTKISPNKTIAGVFGAFIFSLILVPLFCDELIKYNLLQLTLITILISLTSQLGDLFISYLKRKAQVKNTSNILPGHGGLLDRTDGIIFAIPMGMLLYNIF